MLIFVQIMALNYDIWMKMLHGHLFFARDTATNAMKIKIHNSIVGAGHARDFAD
jgi:hypothetical protein